MTIMEPKPGMFETPVEAVAFILAIVALFLCAISALTSSFWESIMWFAGAALIFRGLALGKID